MKEEAFHEFGLTKNEAKVYLTLLRNGSSLAGEITSHSGVHRRNVYDSLHRLMEKGLVSYVTINNRKMFEATDPHRFLGIIEEEKHMLKRKRELFTELLPELEGLKKAKERQEVRYFKGIEGLKAVYDDILKIKKDYVGYGPSDQEKILKHYFTHYIDKRTEAKIHVRLIYEESAKKKKFTKNPFLKVRYLPDEIISHAALRIYGNRVAIMLLSEESPLAIIIENKRIADGYRKYFEVMWGAAKK